MIIYFYLHIFRQKMEKTNSKKKDAENYHYFTWDNKGGVTGIAGVGTICRSSEQQRTAITEWVYNEDEHYSEDQCLLVIIQYFQLLNSE